MSALKPLVLAAILGGAPAVAVAWDYELLRGLDLYQARDGGVSLSLVCDPNSVYGGTTQTGLLVNLGGNVDASLPATFRFPDGIAVQVELVHGRIGKADTEAGSWAALMEGLRAHSTVTMDVAGRTRDLDLGQPMMFTCT